MAMVIHSHFCKPLLITFTQFAGDTLQLQPRRLGFGQRPPLASLKCWQLSSTLNFFITSNLNLRLQIPLFLFVERPYRATCSGPIVAMVIFFVFWQAARNPPKEIKIWQSHTHTCVQGTITISCCIRRLSQDFVQWLRARGGIVHIPFPLQLCWFSGQEYDKGLETFPVPVVLGILSGLQQADGREDWSLKTRKPPALQLSLDTKID